MTADGPRVVAIGGGHGLAMSLRAVRSYAAHVTAVVATGDDGGSSGRLRADLHMPAPGDLRRCLTAMARNREVADGLEHRFGAGELAGHAVGNLVLAGLVDAGHDLATAADLLSGWLELDAGVRVLPATQGPVTVVAATGQGEVRGQVAIEQASGISAITLDPPDPDVADEIVASIDAADQIVLGPGSFHTSVLGAVAVPAIAKSIRATSARTVLVANLDADVGSHLDALSTLGIAVTDVVVPRGWSQANPAGASGVEVVEAAVVRPHGRAHDADLLGPVLASLT